MKGAIELESLLSACSDDGFDDGIRIDTELEPLSGKGGPVKPAVYEGGVYQRGSQVGQSLKMPSLRASS